MVMRKMEWLCLAALVALAAPTIAKEYDTGNDLYIGERLVRDRL